MLSTRMLARSAPRILSRCTVSAMRRPSPFPAPLLQTISLSTRLPSRAAFSTSLRMRDQKSEIEEELIHKISSEIDVEREMKGDDSTPTSVQDFLENSPFQITDTPGKEEVVLERKYGNESIRVAFSISDLNAMDNDADYADRAMEDESEMDPDRLNNDEKSFKQAAQDALSNAENEDMNEQGGEDQQSFPAQLSITISKPNQGAMLVEATAQDGMIIIDNVGFYKSLDFALGKDVSKSFERDDMYAGPPFGNLDEDLQVLMERYLDERGINSALAVFVPDYMDMKEQKEYEGWLGNVKGFLES